MTISDAWLPLFPLHTVLFPCGVLPLKVFEPRYTDMVRDCFTHDRPFGVVLIQSGTEVGTAAQPESVGTLAHIKQWDMVDLGILLLRVEGGEKFRIMQTRTLPDQRLEALIEVLPEVQPQDSLTQISNMHLSCAKALKIVIEDINARGAKGAKSTAGQAEQGNTFHSPFTDPPKLNDAAWVANRWCEILPIPLKARQKLLELDNAHSRLSVVFQYLQQHKIL